MVRCAVHLFLVKDGKILVEKRKNREYCNNQLDVIASHIIGNENAIDAIIRTVKMEVNIDIKKEDLKIIQVMHQKSEQYEYLLKNSFKSLSSVLNNSLFFIFCNFLLSCELLYSISSLQITFLGGIILIITLLFMDGKIIDLFLVRKLLIANQSWYLKGYKYVRRIY